MLANRKRAAADTTRVKTAKIARYERQINELQAELAHMAQEMRVLRQELSATAAAGALPPSMSDR